MDRTTVMTGAKAPGAASPGTGSGNVPFAPGLINGRNLGQQTNQSPLARQAGGQGTVNINVGSGGPPPARPATPPQTPAAPMAGPSIITPDNYMKILDAYMNALLDSVQTGKPLIGGIY
jgi:hypothetical protein